MPEEQKQMSDLGARKCPYCGGIGEVRHTRRIQGKSRRYKKCLKCGRNFITVERLEDISK